MHLSEAVVESIISKSYKSSEGKGYNTITLAGGVACNSALRDKLTELGKENNIDIEIYLGNEIYFTYDLIEKISELDFYCLNKSKYILIEFPPTNFPLNLCNIVYELKQKGFIPVLAHVERYIKIHDDPEIIYDCIKTGAIIQINSSSLNWKTRQRNTKIL